MARQDEKISDHLPSPAEFRKRVCRDLKRHGLAHSRVSVEAGLSKNALGQFLRSGDADFRLGAAASVEAAIRRLAPAEQEGGRE
ncbi:hypothetical protein CVM50_17115 [Pseudooceanicola marinus]|nr:hypothetical protein CVM50_17115 [Pseudooceanicola marinus]